MPNKVSQRRLYVDGAGEVLTDSQIQERADNTRAGENHDIRLLVGMGGTLTEADIEQYGITDEMLAAPDEEDLKLAFGVATGDKQGGQRATSDDDIVGRAMENKVAEARGTRASLPDITKELPDPMHAERTRLRREMGMPVDENFHAQTMSAVGGVEEADKQARTHRNAARRSRAVGPTVHEPRGNDPLTEQGGIDLSALKSGGGGDAAKATASEGDGDKSEE